MYNQYLEVKPCNTGNGIFSKVEIPANTVIMEFAGPVCSFTELPANSANYLQISKGRFISPIGTINGVDFINHSCDPNCYVHVVGNRAFLYSLYVIPENTQLLIDYSTTSTDSVDEWKMDCQCNSNKCRKLISGYQYLEGSLKEDYIKRGLVPMFMTNPIFQKK